MKSKLIACMTLLYVIMIGCTSKASPSEKAHTSIDSIVSDNGEHKAIASIFLGSMVRAYAEGQKDAIDGDIRIVIIDDSIIRYVKSPWDECNDSIAYQKCDPSSYGTITIVKEKHAISK